MFAIATDPAKGSRAPEKPLGSGTPPAQLGDDELERATLELAAHINAATSRFVTLVGEIDRRERWGAWGTRDCAQWVSHACGLSPSAARQHVALAAGLKGLPKTQEAFAAGALSFHQAKALSRAATPETEGSLLELAESTTTAQLERLTSAYRRAIAASELKEANAVYAERYLHHYFDDQGGFVIDGRLAKEDGALVAKALDAAGDSLPSPEELTNLPGEARPTPAARRADALLALAERALACGPRALPGAERYSVIVHVDEETLAQRADDGSSELAGGPSLPPETARRMACDASIVALLERDGKALSAGRKTRRISPALRRALEARDKGCRFPGCTRTRFTDGHHVTHWIAGGQTEPDNVLLLCRFHHRLVHEGGFSLRLDASGNVLVTRPDGKVLAPTVALRASDNDLAVLADLEATAAAGERAVALPWGAGEPLDLDNALWGWLSLEGRLQEDFAPAAGKEHGSPRPEEHPVPSSGSPPAVAPSGSLSPGVASPNDAPVDGTLPNRAPPDHPRGDDAPPDRSPPR